MPHFSSSRHGRRVNLLRCARRVTEPHPFPIARYQVPVTELVAFHSTPGT